MKSDTIAAVATALSNSGISIIRVSGEEAVNVVNSVFVSKSGKHILKNVKSHTIHYGFIYKNDEMIDEVMVSVMKAPKSFTMEDVVEINCHGGILVTKKILELVILQGARLAMPGEFTKRAFLNGRIDLTKAEAIMDLIEAKSDYALKSSAKQLKGVVYDKVKQLREKIIYEIAFIESAIDDPEHISLDGFYERLGQVTDEVLQEVDHLLEQSENGVLLKNGINTVIVGKPNAGKSSLLNRLVGEEKAIVTDVAGTTRDVLKETITLHGISLNLIDTAGIHETEDKVEKIGVDRAKDFAKDADLIVYVVDSSVPLDDSDDEIIDLIREKKTIVLLNKSDLSTVTDEVSISKKLAQGNKNICRMIKTSTKENVGIDEFEHTIKEMFFQGNISLEDEIYITNLRQKEYLYDTKNSLVLVKQSLADEMPEDFYSIDLMNAYTSLGLIIGEEVEDDLVQEIFSKFCMGK
ncbi:MAG: tRNA uridine-5-carboxymethylaminomethyl(34) synthesis GTPase MnmE [Lachnospiraceae bacterium]|nr:tRNA uridine-5-carboxymethylaminomethyl(34) synthesis GTPase MnmE [Lachnospiraceae bacterium]